MALERWDPPISHQVVTNQRKSTVVHYHRRHELYFLVQGETKYFVGDEIFHLIPGDFIFVPSGILHKTDSESCLHNERILLSFDDEVIGEQLRPLLDELARIKIVHIPHNRRYLAEDLLHKLQTEADKQESYHELLTNLYICELITLLCRLKYDYTPAKSESEQLMTVVAEYIRTNYAQDLSLSALGRKFGLSVSFLSRKFKECSGIGINEYITNVRIHNAAILLSDDSLSVTEVAARCGYADSNYFASVFKRIKGTTPLKYAKNQR